MNDKRSQPQYEYLVVIAGKMGHFTLKGGEEPDQKAPYQSRLIDYFNDLGSQGWEMWYYES